LAATCSSPSDQPRSEEAKTATADRSRGDKWGKNTTKDGLIDRHTYIHTYIHTDRQTDRQEIIISKARTIIIACKIDRQTDEMKEKEQGRKSTNHLQRC
jgi:hypothetical protein